MLKFPDYNNCLTNISCSIMAHFGLPYKHATNKELDQELSKNYQNIVLFLFDGMGSNLLDRNLPTDAFLKKHKVKDVTSVFPPTTTSCTTTILSGLNPSEHGWLGWNMIYNQEKIIVSMFPNTLKDTEIPAAPFSMAEKYFAYNSLIDEINKKDKAYYLAPFGENAYVGLDGLFNRVNEILKEDGKKFIYAYSDEPDHTMHKIGTDAKETIDLFATINAKVEEFTKNINDTLVIVIADHGHLNVEPIILCEYPDLINTLDGNIWLEGRSCAFKVKEGENRNFEQIFTKHFGEYFDLYSKQEVILKEFFGPGNYHPKFSESLGDYLAVAKGNKYFRYDYNGEIFKSTHAGISADELYVPLIIYSTK